MSDDNRQLQLPRVRSDFVGAFREWGKDNAPQFAAAIAFYAILSLGPLLVFSISIAAIFFESEAARGEIVGSVQQYIGRGAAEMVQEVIENASERKGGLFASIFGFVVLAFGASRIFQQLKIALNVILDVPDAEEGGIMKMALDRLFSILAVVGFGLFLMASLILNTILGRLDDAIAIPGGSFVWQVLSQALSLALMAVVFALILRYLPDTDTPWKYVWEGAVLAAALFTIGQIVISLYLSQTEPGSSFGAAGPVIVVIVWIYFTTVMFFFSAEFMEVRCRADESFAARTRRKERVEEPRPQEGAIPRPETSRASGETKVVQKKTGGRKTVGLVGTLLGGTVGFVLGIAAAIFGLFAASLRLLTKLVTKH